MKRVGTVLLLLVFVVGAVAWRLADVKPDPNVQAIADGCQRDTTKIYTGLAELGLRERPRFSLERPPAWPALGERDGQRVAWTSGLAHRELG